MNPSEINQLKSELLKIGTHSMFIISESQSSSGKDEVWDRAVKINKIAQNLYKNLHYFQRAHIKI
jgi:hypothetical protein